jgi:hypothetical protein
MQGAGWYRHDYCGAPQGRWFLVPSFSGVLRCAVDFAAHVVAFPFRLVGTLAGATF